MLITDPPYQAGHAGLAALQKAFASALMHPDAELPAAIGGSSEAQRIKRFNVYRNNVSASLAAALAARYPVVERLVGEEFFRAMALVYIRTNPPHSPVLSQYGETFAEFLEQFEPAAALAYLPGVARLEWARNRAYHAADAAPAAIAALAEVAPSRLADVRVALHPAASLVASPYPIVSIWATNTHDAIVKPIGEDAEAECALITRPALEVLVTPLPTSSFPFIAALAEGSPLGEASTKANASGPGFDLSATLAAMFGSGGVGKVLLTAQATS